MGSHGTQNYDLMDYEWDIPSRNDIAIAVENGGFIWFERGWSWDNTGIWMDISSGKRWHNSGKSPYFMGKLTSSMAIFNSYVIFIQRVDWNAGIYLGNIMYTNYTN